MQIRPACRFENAAILLFRHFGLKVLCHTEFWRFLIDFTPARRAVSAKPQKEHPCEETWHCERRVMDRQNRSTGAACAHDEETKQVCHNEDDVGGRARVTRDEEQVLR